MNTAQSVDRLSTNKADHIKILTPNEILTTTKKFESISYSCNTRTIIVLKSELKPVSKNNKGNASSPVGHIALAVRYDLLRFLV